MKADRIGAAFVAALLFSFPVAVAADGGISLTTVRDVFARIDDPTVRTISVAAYALGPKMRITRALLSAADRGAAVAVTLGRGAFGGAAEENVQTAALMRQHRIRVDASASDSHIKAIIVDGTVFLSDRNFSSRVDEGIVVVDNLPDDFRIVDAAMHGRAAGNDHLETRKASALVAEARLLDLRRSHDVVVSTESFGAGTPVFSAMVARRRLGDRVRLLVASREYATSPTDRQAVIALRALGVDVRISQANEKFFVDGDDVWFGSANATRGQSEQIEFGIAMRDAGFALRLTQQFEREWSESSAP